MLFKTLLSIVMAVMVIHALTVDDILDKMEENESASTSRISMTMTVIDPDGRETVSELTAYSADKGEKSLMEYTAPARIKGMKILSLNDGNDIWLYSPRTQRVRKIASNQKNQSVNNSDFSFEDISTGDRRKDYSCNLLADKRINGTDCFTIEMKPKKNGISYSRIVYYVDKSNYLPVEGEYFDESGNLWKKLYMKNPSKTGKYWNAESVEMHNILKGSKTIMKTLKVEYDIELDKELFGERNLKR